MNAADLLCRKIRRKKNIPIRKSEAAAGGLNKLLKEYGIAPVKSCLELFSWADKKREYKENALKTGKVLLSLGGTENIIDSLEKCL